MISHSLSKRKNQRAEKNRQFNSREPSRQSDNHIFGFPFHKLLLPYWRTIFVALLSIKHSTKKSTHLPTFGYICIRFHDYDKLLKLLFCAQSSSKQYPIHISHCALLILSGDNFVSQYLFWIINVLLFLSVTLFYKCHVKDGYYFFNYSFLCLA